MGISKYFKAKSSTRARSHNSNSKMQVRVPNYREKSSGYRVTSAKGLSECDVTLERYRTYILFTKISCARHFAQELMQAVCTQLEIFSSKLICFLNGTYCILIQKSCTKFKLSCTIHTLS